MVTADELSLNGRGRNTRQSPLLRLLEARWSVELGAFSYSLYLTHYPLLAWADAILRSWGCGSDARLALLLLVASPLCLLAAYLFHLVFERPFLAESARREKRVGLPPLRPQSLRRLWTNGASASSVSG